MSWGWLILPVLPLLALVPVVWGAKRVATWLWLVAVSPLLLAIFPPEPLGLPGLWPGALWGMADFVGRSFLALTALLWGAASWYAAADLKGDSTSRRFWVFWLLCMSGNFLLAMAGDGVSFYVGFTLMSLAAYGLVIHLGGPVPRRAGRFYLQLAVLGEMLFYAALVLRIYASDSMDFASWQLAPIGDVTALLLVIGLGIKAGFWPLHWWLPLAHPAAPPAASAVLSGAMIKAGILGLWRFLPADGLPMPDADLILVGLGGLSAIYGVVFGLLQSRVKVALAYSSISQVGYLLAILGLAWHLGGDAAAWGLLLALYAVHHGLAKGALFLGAGLTARYQLTGWQKGLMGLPALALAGLPLTGGAAVKALFKEQLAYGPFADWTLLLSLGSLATGLLVWRILWLMAGEQRRTELAKPPAGQLGPWILLSLSPLLLPWLWPGMLEPALKSLQPGTLWSALWPIGLALGVAWLAVRRQWQVPGVLRPSSTYSVLLSLKLAALLRDPPMPSLPRFTLAEGRWRSLERGWNRLWRGAVVRISVQLLALLLLLGWLWD